MSAGRPTKLDALLKMNLAQYIRGGYKEQGDVIPSIAGFAVYGRVSRGQLHQWRKDNVDPEFSDMIDDLLAEQERILLTGGLSKSFNATVTGLVLSKHGYANKTDHTSSDGSMTPQVTEIRRTVVKPEK